MENLIGKKFVKVGSIKSTSCSQEYVVSDFEIIAGECIIYTSDGKSFRLDDLELSNSDELIELKAYVLEIINDRGLQNEFAKKFNPNCDMKRLIKKYCETPKSKSFKIFGWTITLSKSK